MSIKDELRDTKEQFRLLSLYQRFDMSSSCFSRR